MVIDTLSADPANVRLHDERSIRAIKASLQRFGQQKPVVIDEAGVVIAGNGMLEAARHASGFFQAVFANIVRIMAPGAAIYCWHAQKRICEIIEVWRALGILDHQQIVWVKPVSVFGSVFWHFRHEPCLMGWVQGSKPVHDGRHDHDSVWIAPGTQVPLEQLTRLQMLALLKESLSVWEVDWEGKARPVGNEHPTQKPVEIFARPMRKHTRRGDICFEPFSGSGSQIIAAEQLGRRCMAIEAEPVFVDVAVRRWQQATGQAARLADDGRTWAEVAAARGVSLEVPPCQPDRPAPAAEPAATP